DQPDDLDLFCGEAGIGDDEAWMFLFREDAVNDMDTGFAAEIFFSIQQGGHGFYKFRVVFAFNEIAVNAGVEHFEHGGGVGIKGIGEDAGAGAAVFDLAHDGVAAEIGQDNVYDHQGGMVFDGQGGTGCAGVGVQELHEPLADQQSDTVDDHIVIVDHQDRVVCFREIVHINGIEI